MLIDCEHPDVNVKLISVLNFKLGQGNQTDDIICIPYYWYIRLSETSYVRSVRTEIWNCIISFL